MTDSEQCGPETEPGPLIYVVDDEPLLLDLAEAILEGEGCRVRTFQNPLEAWRAISTVHPKPALLITDYAMPAMNGVELLRRCKGIVPELKCMMVSGTVDVSILEGSGVEVGDFLAKPYLPARLVASVRTLLGRA